MVTYHSGLCALSVFSVANLFESGGPWYHDPRTCFANIVEHNSMIYWFPQGLISTSLMLRVYTHTTVFVVSGGLTELWVSLPCELLPLFRHLISLWVTSVRISLGCVKTHGAWSVDKHYGTLKYCTRKGEGEEQSFWVLYSTRHSNRVQNIGTREGVDLEHLDADGGFDTLKRINASSPWVLDISGPQSRWICWSLIIVQPICAFEYSEQLEVNK